MNRRLVGLILSVLILFVMLPPYILAASFFDSLSLGLEKEIGYNSYQQIIAQKEVVQLPKAQSDRLNLIFNNLVKQAARQSEIKYNLSVVKDDTVNAFALPAGYIFVHTGLISFAKSDGELAGVLGHEIAHVDRRHSMKAVSRTVGMSLLLKLFIDKSDSNRKEQLTKLGAIAINLTELGYSREAEYEADAYGVRFMKAASYSKDELLNFWRRMESQSGGGNSPAFLQFFSTHPPITERIKRIEAM